MSKEQRGTGLQYPPPPPPLTPLPYYEEGMRGQEAVRLHTDPFPFPPSSSQDPPDSPAPPLYEEERGQEAAWLPALHEGSFFAIPTTAEEAKLQPGSGECRGEGVCVCVKGGACAVYVC